MATLEDLIARFGAENVETLERTDGTWLVEITTARRGRGWPLTTPVSVGHGYVEPTLQQAIDAAAAGLLR